MIIASMLLAAAYAGDPELANLDCNKAFTDPEINECARRDLDKVEAQLNKVYKQTLAGLAGPDDFVEARKQLVAAQREWVKFRELDCQGKFTYNRSGSIRTVVYLSCMEDYAKLRITQLENWTDL